jgi:hypothetical protein
MKLKKTVTERVLAANRANAEKSTGPRKTQAVKQNARKHGLLSESLLFKSEEERQNFDELLNDLQDEQNPSGRLERILVEEVAASVWKLRTTNAWETKELLNRRKAAKAVLQRVAENNGHEQLQLFSSWDPRGSAAQRGWDCQELVIRTWSRNRERDRNELSPENIAVDVQVEAKLTSSLDTILRYRAAIKRDLYRAFAVLRDIRHHREEV